jgi:hypothetical protein
MRRSYFFEGLFFGTVIGLILGYFFDIEEETKKVIDKASHLNLNNEDSEESDTVESSVERTLEAIEQGFEKLTNIVEKKKDS